MLLCLAARARVIERIKSNDDVLGVTSVGDELFVLLLQKCNQVAVYSVIDYQLLHYLNLPELEPDRNSDLTSCIKRHKRLYVSDFHSNCIYGYELVSNDGMYDSSAIIEWLVPGSPCGLSVTPSCNLLVTCQQPNKLVELSADSGQCVREIALQEDVVNPRHGIQLTTGQYVVCCGGWFCHLHQVCMVDDDGRVICSYGGQRGSDADQLDRPSHLAVDEEMQSVFVADFANDRVVMLNPTLKFVRHITVRLRRPRRLYWHHTTRRLYVGQWLDEYGLVVIQL